MSNSNERELLLGQRSLVVEVNIFDVVHFSDELLDLLDCCVLALDKSEVGDHQALNLLMLRAQGVP